jgi:hypothetical protein
MCFFWARISLSGCRKTLQVVHSFISAKLTREKENQKHNKNKKRTETTP